MARRNMYRAITVVETTTVEVVCNACGEPIEEYGCAHSFPTSGGYPCSFPGDMMSLQFDLCCGCLESIVQQFKIPPLIDGGYPPTELIVAEHEETHKTFVVEYGWARDPDMPLEELWKATKGQDVTEGTPEWDFGLDHINRSNRDQLVWEHFSGKRYQVLDVARLLTTREQVVVYRALYDDCKTWLRPFAKFQEHVEREGYSGPRFRLLS